MKVARSAMNRPSPAAKPMITPRFDIPPDYLAEQGLSPNFARSFWKRVFFTPTHWLWEGQRKQRSKHGILWRGWSKTNNRRIFAHVASWILHYGPIPDDKLVLHCCPGRHISWCVNPEHLYLGNAADNRRDLLDQWAQRFSHRKATTLMNGERNPSCKLSQEIVDEIRSRYTGAFGQQSFLAREYGVTQAAIWMIVNHKNWIKAVEPRPHGQ